MEVNINSSNFEKEVIEHKGTVIVDFYGSWCMPCKMIAPIVEKVVADNNFKDFVFHKLMYFLYK